MLMTMDEPIIRRGGNDAHRQAVGGMVDLVADLVEAFEVQRNPHLAFWAAAETGTGLRQFVGGLAAAFAGIPPCAKCVRARTLL